jgi:hypothetical protein
MRSIRSGDDFWQSIFGAGGGGRRLHFGVPQFDGLLNATVNEIANRVCDLRESAGARRTCDEQEHEGEDNGDSPLRAKTSDRSWRQGVSIRHTPGRLLDRGNIWNRGRG